LAEVTNGDMNKSEEKNHDDTEESATDKWSLRLFITGFIVIFVGVSVLVSASMLQGSSTSAGVVIFVGPIPIALGVGLDAPLLILISVILTALSIILFFILRRKSPES
jgi:uncharacterized membrane protein